MTMKKKILCTLALIGAMSTSAFADSTTVAIDGKVVENSNVVVENGVTYIPVRPVAEALGLNVEWTAETKSVAISNGGPLYITFTIGENGYTIAKTAPMPLSAAPVIINSSAYIPADVVTDLLSFDIKEDKDTLNIITGNDTLVEDDVVSEEAVEPETVIGTGIVAEVSEEEILFNDEVKGDVRLNKSDAVKVTDEDGNEVDINSIDVDAKLKVEYGKAMTMSIPPLNNPVSITILK